MPKVFISTIPFGESDDEPLRVLKKAGIEYRINPEGRKLTPEEVGEYAREADALIAGTEDVATVLGLAPNLRIVSRVGVGLDSVPLGLCRERGVCVAYTPAAMSPAVAELAVGAMLCAARGVCAADRRVRRGEWRKPMGRRLGGAVIGLVGFGRIGSLVARYAAGFQPAEVLVSDVQDLTNTLKALAGEAGLAIRQVELAELLEHAHFVSLHAPLTPSTRHMIGAKELDMMREEAVLLNLARGGLVDEAALLEALQSGRIAGAVLDCFEQEPYDGPLRELDNVILTPHMGSSSADCRTAMEVQAARNVADFFRGETPAGLVPESEYLNQAGG